MKQQIDLSEISRANKLAFLKSLQSGIFTLSTAHEPQPGKTFELIDSGFYKCKNTGEQLTAQEINALPGYQMILELVATRAQVSHEEPVKGYILCPWSNNEYLNSLLKAK